MVHTVLLLKAKQNEPETGASLTLSPQEKVDQTWRSLCRKVAPWGPETVFRLLKKYLS